MSHKIWVLIATALAEDTDIVRQHVRESFRHRKLRQGIDFDIFECPSARIIREKIGEAEESDHTVLLVTEQHLTNQDDVTKVIKRVSAKIPESVILLNLDGNLPRSLPVRRSQVIRGLDDVSLNLLDELVGRFVRDDIERVLNAYNRFALELEEYKRDWCTPLTSESSASSKAFHDDFDNQLADVVPDRAKQQARTPEEIWEKWSNLAERIKTRAKEQLEEAKDSTITEDDPRLTTIQAMLHLWVEARLCALRARSNYRVFNEARMVLLDRPDVTTLKRIPPGFGIGQNRPAMDDEVDKVVDEYYDTLHLFDASLLKSKAPKWSLFRQRFGDAEQFRVWSKQFGPNNVLAETEPGWEIHAASAERELYYHYRDALRHELLLGKRLTSAALMWVFKVIAGFGFQPARTAKITIGAIIGFGILHWLDDTRSGCIANTPHVGSILSEIQYYFSISISSLTSLGSAVTPCGSFHGLLLASETLFGYFLLAILTTLFVQSLSDR